MLDEVGCGLYHATVLAACSSCANRELDKHGQVQPHTLKTTIASSVQENHDPSLISVITQHAWIMVVSIME